MGVADLFKEDVKTRFLLQVVMTQEDKARGQALQRRLRHMTMGRIWRFCIRTGLDKLEFRLRSRKIT